MNENEAVILEMEEAKQSGQRIALATVVKVTGSAYRREGAKMLVTEDGATVGLISGGCLESDVAEMAKQVIVAGRPQVQQYAMGEDLVWGLGLGCPGTVDLFIESVSEGDAAFEAWIQSLKDEKPAILATVLKASNEAGCAMGSRLFVSAEGLSAGTFGSEILTSRIREVAERKLNQLHPKSETLSFSLDEDNEVAVFIDVNVPPLELMIFGAGHDAVPVARFARQLGMRTIIVDPRPAYATEEQFPGTQIILARPEHLQEKVRPGRQTFTIIMNHHLERDQMCLRFALESPAAYVGVLGPRKRRKWLFDGLNEQGVTFTEEQLSRIYNPIGLDIGAETSEEVAVSIVSEILAIRNGHQGGFLREKGSIHVPARE